MSAAPLPVRGGPGEPESLGTPSRSQAGRRGRALLALVPPPVRARRAPFIALLLVLLAAGLVGLLLLNTASAQDAFRLHALQSQAAALTEQKEALASNTDGLDDPAQLAKAAAKLGLVNNDSLTFLAPGQPLPKGAIRLGDLAYIPGPPVVAKVVTPAPAATPVPSLTPAAKKPATKAPVAKAPVAKAPVTKAPVAKTPATKTPTAKTPITRTPVAKAPVARTPAITAPVGQPAQTLPGRTTGGG